MTTAKINQGDESTTIYPVRTSWLSEVHDNTMFHLFVPEDEPGVFLGVYDAAGTYERNDRGQMSANARMVMDPDDALALAAALISYATAAKEGVAGVT